MSGHGETRRDGGYYLAHAMLIVAVVIVLAPFVWIGAAAFKTQIMLLLGKVLFTPTLKNFHEVLASKTSDYLTNFGNSVIVATASTAIVLVSAFLGAYSLVRMHWPRAVVLIFLVWAMIFQMLPPVTLAGAWYELFASIGLRNSLAAVILGHATLNMPMAIWLLATFLREVPHEIEEAAKIDGAGQRVLLLKVIVPIVMPGLVATGLLTFIFSWNEFPVALALTSSDTATVPVGIAKFAQANEIKYTEMAAASVFSAIPALLALIFGQRFIVRGITSGAVKS
jgi:multiple sugar transport system permease protein